MCDPRSVDRNLEDVARRHDRMIRRAVARGSDHDREDLVQEVYLRLGRHVDQIGEGEERLRSFILRTVRSVLIDAYRRTQHDVARLDPERVEAPSDRRAEDFEDALGAAWRGLDERSRAVLDLRFRAGMTFREIGIWMDEPEGSVSAWYARAMRQLRERRT